MNIFNLAEYELQTRENKTPENCKNYLELLLQRAIKIRKYMDIQVRNTNAAKSRYAKI